MHSDMSRRSFLVVASSLAIGTATGRQLVDAVLHSEPAVTEPKIGWRAAAAEAFEAEWLAHDHWLRYAQEAGGLDDLHDTGGLIPVEAAPSAPFELAQVIERQRCFRAERRKSASWLALPCVPSEVAAMPTSEIRARLAARGIDASPRAFFTLVRETVSPWAIACRWVEGRDLPGPEEDLVSLAAWELWARTSPKPHDERIDDWAHCILPDCDRGDPPLACALGLRAWDQLRPRWSRHARTTEEADRLWAGCSPTWNFVESLARRLRQAGDAEPKLRDRAELMIEEALAIFGAEEHVLAQILEEECSIIRRAIS